MITVIISICKLIYNGIERILITTKNNILEKEKNEKIRELYNHGYSNDMTGGEFEKYCLAILLKYSWRASLTKASGDHGVDIIAYSKSKSIGIQCKKYKERVGNKAIQEAYTGSKYYDLDKPIVVTNSIFTKQAINEANKLNVVLINIIYFEEYAKGGGKYIHQKNEKQNDWYNNYIRPRRPWLGRS